MKQVFDDYEAALLGDPRLAYIKKGGGVFSLKDMESYPQQQKTPCIVLTDGGTGGARHMSSAVRWMPFNLIVHCVQRIFNRQEIVKGSILQKSVEEIAFDVRHSIDMNRIGGKYARMLFRSDAEPTVLDEGSMHLVEKQLTFEVVRIE